MTAPTSMEDVWSHPFPWARTRHHVTVQRASGKRRRYNAADTALARRIMTAPADLRQHLNGETARIAWRELERHFARGAVVTVDPGLDLIDVAVFFFKQKTAY